MKRKIAIVSLSTFILLFLFWFFYLRTYKERELIKQGDEIIHKIEAYESKNGYLPNSLEDIGIKEKDESDPPLYYQKAKNASYEYSVSFGTSLGESKIYYSDSKKWEDYQR